NINHGDSSHHILHRSLRIEAQIARRYHSTKTETVQGNLRRIGDFQDAVDSARNDGPDNLGTAEVFIFFGNDTPVQHVHIIPVLHQKFDHAVAREHIEHVGATDAEPGHEETGEWVERGSPG